MGQLNVKNEELEAMVKEASGPINFTVFLTMFGEKLKGMYTRAPIKLHCSNLTSLSSKQFSSFTLLKFLLYIFDHCEQLSRTKPLLFACRC